MESVFVPMYVSTCTDTLNGSSPFPGPPRRAPGGTVRSGRGEDFSGSGLSPRLHAVAVLGEPLARLRLPEDAQVLVGGQGEVSVLARPASRRPKRPVRAPSPCRRPRSRGVLRGRARTRLRRFPPHAG